MVSGCEVCFMCNLLGGLRLAPVPTEKVQAVLRPAATVSIRNARALPHDELAVQIGNSDGELVPCVGKAPNP
jgi:hypothetical protein